MSPSPASASEEAAVQKYGAAWADIMALARKGYSWSGHERNVCYLNEGTGRFANVSSLSGLDFPDDGRALGLVDWDHDGDLDLWFRNRTAPRLRFMVNLHAGGAADFVAVRLEGKTSNRDGVGAIVEVFPVQDDGAPVPPLVKSLHAGGLFLSQSSKWLHFGLADADRVGQVVVRWPGGKTESFRGVAPGGRFVLAQGSGVARAWQRSVRKGQAVSFSPSAVVAAPRPPSTARVVLPRRIPFPRLAYRSATTKSQAEGARSGPRLLVIWASSCAHCRAELASLARDAKSLRAAGLSVLALSVDGVAPDSVSPDSVSPDSVSPDSVSPDSVSPDSVSPDSVAGLERAVAVIDQLAFPFPWGLIDAASLARVEQFQTALFDRTVATAVPLSFLLDGSAGAVAIYRGPVDSQSLARDARDLVQASNEELHRLAPPLPGQWFTRFVDDAAMAEFMARQFQSRLPEDSLRYLQLAAERSEGSRRDALRRELATRHRELALRYEREQKPEPAAFHFQAALENAPDSAEIHQEFGAFLGSYGALDDAEEHFRRALVIRPGYEHAHEGLELIRKLREEGSE